MRLPDVKRLETAMRSQGARASLNIFEAFSFRYVVYKGVPRRLA